tara:strand:- start:1347 stop:1553 length:207 start_codon:yes stop_codon:yes gene_type:complete
MNIDKDRLKSVIEDSLQEIDPITGLYKREVIALSSVSDSGVQIQLVVTRLEDEVIKPVDDNICVLLES